MKNNKFLTALMVLALFVSCNNDDNATQDPVYEFVSFQNETLTVNENGASTKPSPIVLKLYGHEPKEDITVNFGIVENNVQEGMDYTLSSKSVAFRKGSFISDTLYVSTIDNAAGSDMERSFEIKIESISNPDIRIGLGIDSPKKSAIKVVIADDECSETIDVFSSNSLTNTTAYGTHTIRGSLSGNTVRLVGDLISYGAFPNAALEVILTPASEGATKGTATFENFDAGTDNDGYVYQFRQIGEGTYDVCSGEIVIDFEVYYESGGSWVYWYTSNNVITVP